PADDDRIGRTVANGVDAALFERGLHSRAAADQRGRSRWHERRRSAGRAHHVAALDGYVEAGELGDVVVLGHRRVVGEEDHTLARLAQATKGAGRTGYGAVTAPDDTVEIEDPRHRFELLAAAAPVLRTTRASLRAVRRHQI